MANNPKYFNTYVKGLTRTQTKICPFTNKKGEIICEELAEVLQQQYKSVWTDPKDQFKISDRETFFDENQVSNIGTRLSYLIFTFVTINNGSRSINY